MIGKFKAHGNRVGLFFRVLKTKPVCYTRGSIIMEEQREHFFSGIVWLIIALLLLGLALAVTYFGKGSSQPATDNSVLSSRVNVRPAREYVVFYKAGVFGPTNIRIHVGDSVRFENDSVAGIRIVSDGVSGKLDLPGFDSKTNIQANDGFTFKFPKVGIFGYHNMNNPDEGGSVIVRP